MSVYKSVDICKVKEPCHQQSYKPADRSRFARKVINKQSRHHLGYRRNLFLFTCTVMKMLMTKPLLLMNFTTVPQVISTVIIIATKWLTTDKITAKKTLGEKKIRSPSTHRRIVRISFRCYCTCYQVLPNLSKVYVISILVG